MKRIKCGTVEALDLTTYTDTQDPYKVVGKTYRTADEAFKTATYATAGWKQKTEWQDCIEFMGGFFLTSPLIAFCLYVGYIVIKSTT